MLRLDVTFLKRGLLVFWASWLSLVFTTNLLDAFQTLGLLGGDWRLASGNFQAIAETTARYHFPNWLNGGLFAGVIAWEGAAALLFWRAAYVSRAPREIALPARNAAFIVSLGLWAAFLLVDELFIAYKIEDVHRNLFTAELATLLVVYLLPESPTTDDRSAGRVVD